MGAPKGNTNNKKGKPITDMLYRICVQEDWNRLRNALNKQLDKANDGDSGSLTFITERLEGKATQVLAGDPDNPVVIQEITRVVKRPGD